MFKHLSNKLINYLIHYPNLHMVQLKQAKVFLIAVSYHSKATNGATESGAKGAGSLWSQIVKFYLEQEARNRLSV